MLKLLNRARDDRERDLARVGIPFQFWRQDLRELPFRRCAVTRGQKPETYGPDSQRRALKQLVIQPKNQLVVIGSTPTDEGALAAASWVARELREHEFVIRWVNAELTRDRLPSNTAIYCIHNVLHHASDQRVEAVRDLLLRFQSPVRIVAVAGCLNPFEFCTNRLGLVPDFCCRVEDPT